MRAVRSSFARCAFAGALLSLTIVDSAVAQCQGGAAYGSVCGNYVARPSEMRGSGGGASSGGGSVGVNRGAAALGAINGMLGVLGSMADEERRQQEGQIARLSALSADSNQKGLWFEGQGRLQEALEAFEAAANYAAQAGENENVEINQRNANSTRERIQQAARDAEEAEKRRLAAIDARKRNAIANPWGAAAASGGSGNPFDRPAAAVTPGTDPVCRDGENCYDLGGKGKRTAAKKPAEESTKASARNALRELIAAKSRADLDAQIALLEKTVAGMAQGPERDRLEKLIADIRQQAGGAVPVSTKPIVTETTVASGSDGNANPFDQPASVAKPADGPLSAGAAEALKRPAPGNYKNLSQDDCRKWRGQWSANDWGGSCTIRETYYEGQGPGAGGGMMIVDEVGPKTDRNVQTVRQLVQDAQRDLYGKP